jgi:hypothetical protein
LRRDFGSSKILLTNFLEDKKFASKIPKNESCKLKMRS